MPCKKMKIIINYYILRCLFLQPIQNKTRASSLNLNYYIMCGRALAGWLKMSLPPLPPTRSCLPLVENVTVSHSATSFIGCATPSSYFEFQLQNSMTVNQIWNKNVELFSFQRRYNTFLKRRIIRVVAVGLGLRGTIDWEDDGDGRRPHSPGEVTNDSASWFILHCLKLFVLGFRDISWDVCVTCRLQCFAF